MKPLRYLFLALAVFFAIPSAVALIDLWAWILLGDSLSGIYWPDRWLMAIMMLAPAVWSLLASFGVRDAADR